MKTLTFYEFERHTSEQTQYIALEHALFAYYNEGFGVDRYFLEDGPFVNKAAMSWLESHGIAALPLVIADGEVLCEGRYPTIEELATYYGAPLPKVEIYSCCEENFCTFKNKK
ncbi:MAG: arsenic metallochaperone ArsD family protein [Erysipelotrichaceae bacterium]|nr:arsenic metallochaperone ArsD family protein [Erysipelotrichaceae bacterium]